MCVDMRAACWQEPAHPMALPLLNHKRKGLQEHTRVCCVMYVCMLLGKGVRVRRHTCIHDVAF
jgi:hypothetical protein